MASVGVYLNCATDVTAIVAVGLDATFDVEIGVDVDVVGADIDCLLARCFLFSYRLDGKALLLAKGGESKMQFLISFFIATILFSQALKNRDRERQ